MACSRWWGRDRIVWRTIAATLNSSSSSPLSGKLYIISIASVKIRSEPPLTRMKNTAVLSSSLSDFVAMIERVLNVSTSVMGGRKWWSGMCRFARMTVGSW